MVATEATLRLFFFGLMAFVPNDVTQPTELTVILLDARRPPLATDGCPIHSHTPVLFYKPQEVDKCHFPCRVVNGLCRCELDREEVCLKEVQDPNRASESRTTNPVLSWWNCVRGRTDFCLVPHAKRTRRFVTNWYMKERIREDFIVPPAHDPCSDGALHSSGSPYGNTTGSGLRSPFAEGQHAEEMPPLLAAARMRFMIDAIGVCKLAGQEIDPDGYFRAEEFEFLPNTGEDNWFDFPPQQQMAEIMVMDVPVEEVAVDGKPRVRFTIRAFDATEEFTVELDRSKGCDPPKDYKGPGCPRYLYEMVVANMATVSGSDHAYGRCTHSVARDFELYHDLAGSPKRLYHRPTAKRQKKGKFEHMGNPMSVAMCNSDTLEALFVHFDRSGTGRPVCPQATLTSPTP